jgi:type II secretory ATPase GspE/PulE/Tfp pilus assembly ATPase PilB-like protein
MDIINAIYDLILGVLNQSQQSVILSPQESFFWIPLAFAAVSTAVSAGMRTLSQSCLQHIVDGKTTVDEFVRVLGYANE